MDKPHLMSGGRYPVLRSLGILYLIGAGVSALAGVAAIIWALVDGPGDMADRFFIALGILAGTFMLCVSMLAIAEVLKLFIDVEHNTRMAGSHLPATTVASTPSTVDLSGTPTTPSAHVNRIAALDEETAEAALIRGH